MKDKSRKFFLLVLFVMMAACNVCAENYPYRSDFLWVTVPDHTDWLYKTGEKALVEVQLILFKDNANREQYKMKGNRLSFLLPRCRLSYSKIMQTESNTK